MSADENFRTRWSRRKREAAQSTPDQATPKDTVDRAIAEAPTAAPPPGEAEPIFDPASLPPIDSIGAGSEIGGFLAPGVPADLARAALRRAWSADPAIRDFIGLSENSWDFNAPGSLPGFGSLKPEDVRRLLGQATEEKEAAGPAPGTETLSADQAQVPARESGLAPHDAAQEQMNQGQPSGAAQGDPASRGREHDAARQHETRGCECDPPLPRRRHGGALPE